MPRNVPTAPSAPSGNGTAPGARLAERAALVLALGALAALALASASHLFVAQPMADDYAIAVETHAQGAFGYGWDFYFRQSGRLLGHALGGVLLGYAEMTRSYPWVLCSLAVVWLLALHAFLRALLGASASRARTFGWALGLFVLSFATRPAPGESLYWATGAVQYQLGLSLALVLLAGLVAGVPRLPRVAEASVLAFLALLVPGMHEVTGMVLAVVLVLGVFRAGVRRRLWILCLAACSLATLLTLIAPGNSARATLFEHAHDVGWTLRHFPGDAAFTLWDWASDPRLLAATACLWLSPAFRGPRPEWVGPGSVRRALLVLVALLVIGFAGPRWATGNAAVSRVEDLLQQMFLVLWLLVLFVATRGGRALGGTPRALLRAGALLALAAALVADGNGRHALGDLVHGRAREWREHMQARYETLRAAAEDPAPREVRLPRPPWTPTLLVRMDVREDPTYWHNVYVARYFGVKSVALEPAGTDSR